MKQSPSILPRVLKIYFRTFLPLCSLQHRDPSHGRVRREGEGILYLLHLELEPPDKVLHLHMNPYTLPKDNQLSLNA
jgi:hypothetical protein